MKKALLILIACRPITILSAETWIGNAGTDWFNTANWSPANIPTSTTNVVFNAGSSNYPILTANAVCHNLTMATAPLSAIDTFIAEYVHAAAHIAGYDSTQRGPGIHHISRSEYWLINRTPTTASNVKITLGFNAPNSGIIDNMASLTVAHW